MKQLFAKYLPAKGAYGIGNTIQLGLMYEVLKDDEDVGMAEKFKYPKVQLFLCTKEIPKEQSGNRVYHDNVGWGERYIVGYLQILPMFPLMRLIMIPPDIIFQMLI